MTREKLVNEANGYLRELAALRVYHPSVRLRAIGLLDKHSELVLKQIVDKEPDSQFGLAAKARLEYLADDAGLLGKLFKS